MSEVEHGYAPPSGPHPRVSNQAWSAECRREDGVNAIYMKFKFWATSAGLC